ncbi:hypothetical protein FT663_04397 [Candidozyma haemuli var. vulneris]|uniref:Actin cytoskeleton-regulatory complex protein SLA1 n=1 Tax=Candidozyma haemuli TaxID=45357 RepID=A0A2V1ASX4_9ASCO|nr:hypothetical protein CXQ85_000157 [[Candida] haemuloni]KAF3987580.1 hypothetical protein FT663_04397 [[Candida] haemuloni var. vulneris]KAF3988902.1 hypothetical protein FT662_03135 [[Candida] haemuloni var. vulneris]PVH21190.1 hypothetical protein CXQ85_000157 [[Candida] haemuloni]
MASLYIGVYKALYDYPAQAEEELTIQQDDLLYLLEKSDIDDWWKAKKRVLPVGDEEVEEPLGLVPANYIEEAPVVKQCRGLYDYDKQTEEELSFKEGEIFSVYDLNDPDWLLVGDSSGNGFGFIPSNYIEFTDQAAPLQPTAQPAAQAAPARQQLPLASFAPPPVHKDRAPSRSAEPEPLEPVERPIETRQPEPQEDRQPARSNRYQAPLDDEDDEDDDFEDALPPPMPSRPTGGAGIDTSARGSRPPSEPTTPSRGRETEDVPQTPPKEHNFDGEYFRWYIDEVDGRKKRPVVVSVGNGLIILKPNTQNPKKLRLRSASSLDNNWRIRDLESFSHEKKHVFLKFQNPDAEIELHAGSKDVAEAIMAVLGDLKGAENQKGLREVARAASTKTSSSNKKVGRLMYDFESQGSDELACQEGDEVHILDDTKSREWWMCERLSDGRRGVIPSTYIEIIGTTNLDKLTDGPSRRKSQKSSSKGRVVDKKQRYHSRDERDRIRESDRARRDKRSSSGGEDKNMPNFHRVRTWIDSTGSFKVEAEFLGCMEGKIHLHKTNGVKIAVAATKLSIEDLEYVEKITGTSLQHYKDEVAKHMAKRNRSSGSGAHSSGVSPAKTSSVAAINDVAPPQPSRPKATTATSSGEPDYDWFDFFLSCGVDIGNCQRYSINFAREQMDESILEDITPSLLRSLGLREGDILRVMKHLDNKFGRQKTGDAPATSGGLFTEATGALKNNSSTEVSKVDASALPAPSPQKEKDDPIGNKAGNKFEDDAWAVKPAARSNEDFTQNQTPSKPQYTGSLQDLVDIKPLEANKPPQTPSKDTPSGLPSAPALTPSKTAASPAPAQQPQQTSSQQSQNPALVPLQKTGGQAPLVLVRTGGPFVPMQTGGYMAAQPTGFMPITAQPTGFMPIQPTGLGQQQTSGMLPLKTGQMEQLRPAPPPPTSFGQMPLQPTSSFVPLQPGNVTMPQTTFGQQPTGQPTGGFGQQPTGGFGQQPQTTFGQQPTGGFSQQPPTTFGQQPTGGQFGQQPPTSFGQQPTGGFGQQPQTSFGQQPQTSFGQQPQTTFGQQRTGGTLATQVTGGLNKFVPQSSFGRQITGGVMPQTSFGNQPTGGMPNTSFGGQATGGFPQTSFGNQPTGGFPQTSFGGQPSGGMPPTSFGAPQPQGQPFTSFGQQQQPQQGFNNNMNQMTNMFQNTSIGGPFQQQQQQQPPTSFGQNFGQGQNQFEGFGDQPLQSQPTGLGFGNAPLQSQQTGRRANLQAATAENPFGF